MPTKCTICYHSDRARIDSDLIAGQPLSEIARTYKISTSAAHRHRHRHLVGPIAQAAKTRKEAMAQLGGDLLTKISEIEFRARAILNAAEAAGSLTASLGALRELRETVKLLGQVTQQLHTGPMTINNFILTPEWTLLKSAIANALRKHPDALRDVLLALKSLNVENDTLVSADIPGTASDPTLGLPGPNS